MRDLEGFRDQILAITGMSSRLLGWSRSIILMLLVCWTTTIACVNKDE
jgi:hypothetical protein